MVPEFTLDQINEATNNFSTKNFISKGGEGEVYKGELQIGTSQPKTTVAVKKLSPKTHEFEKEIELLENLRHANLVALQGICRENDNQILVYEYIQNGNLRENLVRNPSLTWMQRLNICCGAARGLNHLHSGASTKYLIIHRDIKPENILLDESLNAKVSDFGISKKGTVDDQKTVAINTLIAGTTGYFAPELIFNREFTQKTDVYAFGVVLFEVLCKRKPPLPKVFRNRDKENETDETVAKMAREYLDPYLREKMNMSSIESFIDITARCLIDDPYERPTMSKVVSKLEKTKQALRNHLQKVKSLPTSSKPGISLDKELSLPTSARQATSAPSTRQPSSEKVTSNIPTEVPRPTPSSTSTVSEIYLAGEEDKIVLYHTSFSITGKVRDDCEEVVSILKEYDQVEKRDFSRKESYRTQLQQAFKVKPYRLPQLFIGGRHAGGAYEILQLHKSGELDKLFEAFTADLSNTCSIDTSTDKIILYHTSFSIVKKVLDDCEEVLSILKESDPVEKRDVSRKESYRTQIQQAFKGKPFRLPQLFVGEKLLGGSDRILELFKSGQLDELFSSFI